MFAFLALIIAIPALFFLQRWLKTDQQYAAVPPGVIDEGGPTRRVDKAQQVAVRFSPPDVEAYAVGFLERGKVLPKDIVPLLLTLAVKGSLRIQKTDVGYTVHDTYDYSKLSELELFAHQKLFANAPEVALDKTDVALRQRMRDLWAHLHMGSASWGFFLDTGKKAAMWINLGLLCVSGVLMFAFTFPIETLALQILVVAGWIMNARGVQRSALGRALYDQSAGFKLYLETAEAAQLKWEEANDIFSRYLPYAIAYGCADRWVALFKDLAAMHNQELGAPDWFVLSGADLGTSMAIGAGIEAIDSGAFSGLGDSFGDFATSMSDFGSSFASDFGLGDSGGGFDFGGGSDFGGGGFDGGGGDGGGGDGGGGGD